MKGQPTPDTQDTFFGDGEVSYRTVPTLTYLWSVFKRNGPVIAVILFALSPFVLFKVFSAGKTYESVLALHFDSIDSFQFDGRSSDLVEFAEAGRFLAMELDDLVLTEDLAKNFPPTASEQPSSALAEKYPSLQIVRWLISAPPREVDLKNRGRLLRSRLYLSYDLGIRSSTMMQLSATGPDVEDAQRLVSVAANLLIERFYKREIERVNAAVTALNEFLENQKVKDIVEKSRQENLEGLGNQAKGRPNVQSSTESKVSQKSAQKRIKEINEEIRGTISRRMQLETSLAELSRRYGPFHPERRAVETQIADLRSKDGMATLSQELKNLEGQLISAESDAEAIAAAEDMDERADKMIQKVYGRLDRLRLEQEKLSEQLAKPEQRMRLAILGGPSNPIDGKSKKLKIALLGAGSSLALSFLIIVLREFFRKKASDKWPLDWKLNLPCLLEVRASNLVNMPFMDKKTIQIMRQKIPTRIKGDDEMDVFLGLRSLGLWVKNHTQGQVLLFARGSNDPKYAPFIYRTVGVYARDYAGRCLLIDFNAGASSQAQVNDEKDTTLLDAILQKISLEQAVQNPNVERGFDFLVANSSLEMRLSEVISSAKFAEFMNAARRIYHKIFILGMGPENFVENSTLLARSTDCVIIVDAASSTFDGIHLLKKKLDREKVSGYVFLSV